MTDEGDGAPAGTGAPRENLGKNSDSERITVDDILECAQTLELCHDSAGRAFMTLPIGDGGQLTYPADWPEVRHWLRREVKDRCGVRPASGQLKEAAEVLRDSALFDSPELEVHLRFGHTQGKLYIDIGDATGRVIEVDATGYRLVNRPPILFWRSAGMQALPEPKSGGTLDSLTPLMNIARDDFDVLTIFWLAVLMPSGTYPILDFDGEEGTGKTGNSLITVRLLDPRVPALKGDPKEPKEVLILGEHAAVVGIDNLSSMTKGLADALCRITSGTGALTKKNYSDTEEVLFTAHRPVVMNGIPFLQRRPDVADRTLRVCTPPIGDHARLSEEYVNEAFAEAHPYALGALLDGASKAVRRRAEVSSSGRLRPRLADVAIQAEAAGPAFGWEDGHPTKVMLDNRKATRRRTVDTSVVASTLVEYAKAQCSWTWFDGSATDLLAELRVFSDDAERLPKAANQLSAEVTDLQATLRSVGVVISRYRAGHRGDRNVTVRYVEPADDADDGPRETRYA